MVRRFDKAQRKKSLIIGPEKYSASKKVKQMDVGLETIANTTIGTPEYYDLLFARSKGKDIFDMPAGILTYENKPRLYE